MNKIQIISAYNYSNLRVSTANANTAEKLKIQEIKILIIQQHRGQVSGSRKNPFNQPKNPEYQKSRNAASNIDGTDFSGHSLDRLQDRGIPISVVKEAINYGVKSDLGNGISKYHDAKNNISVIVNNEGKVITVRYGK